MEYTRISR